jgi:hypothetical protein
LKKTSSLLLLLLDCESDSMEEKSSLCLAIVLSRTIENPASPSPEKDVSKLIFFNSF